MRTPPSSKSRTLGIDSGAQCGFGHDAPSPNRVEQIVPADDSFAVANEVQEQVEYLRLNAKWDRTPQQLAAVRIPQKFLESIAHAGAPGGRF
jgi:hypothetical protein